MRRILLLITDLEIGGTPTVVRELAMRLGGEREMHTEVACLARWGGVATQLDDAGISVTALGARSSFELPRAVRGVVRLVHEHQIDTVFSFLIHANTVAAVASWFCPGVRFLQSIQTTQPSPRWHWWLQRLVQHAAERVVVPSPSAAAVAHDWAEVPRERIIVIPNAIDPEQFKPTSTRERIHQPVRIGFIGRLDPVKRIGDLLQAVAALDDGFELHIFGEGPERQHLRSLIDRLGIRRRATLHGTVARPQTALRQMDLLVLPSQAEGFGLVLIEAMATGVPVVATDVAGICDVVRDGHTGLLVPPASPPALVRAIQRIFIDDALRNRLRDNALQDVRRHFTWDVVLPMYTALLDVPQSAPAQAAAPAPALENRS